MEKFGRHIRKITTSRDVQCEDARVICKQDRFDPNIRIEYDANKKIDEPEFSSSLLCTQIFTGLTMMFLVIHATIQAVWTFIMFILIPTIRYSVLPILFGLTKSLLSIFRFVSKESGKAIETTKQNYRNNTTNWP